MLASGHDSTRGAPAWADRSRTSLPRPAHRRRLRWTTSSSSAGTCTSATATSDRSSRTSGQACTRAGDAFGIMSCCCRKPCGRTACRRSRPARQGRRASRRAVPSFRSTSSAMSHELGTSALYVPSMRNGRLGDPADDRGSAILSTLPLSAPIAVELPGERQRRVVIIAKAGPRIGWPSSTSMRLAAANGCGCFGRPGCETSRSDRWRLLLPGGPLVLGADLNTWHGRDELAARFLEQRFRETPLSVDRQGLGLRVLDYMFFRAGPGQRAPVPAGGKPIWIGPSTPGWMDRVASEADVCSRAATGASLRSRDTRGRRAARNAGVIEPPQVHELVNQHVVGHRIRHQHQTPIQTDVTRW